MGCEEVKSTELAGLTGHGGGYSTTSTIRAIYGSIPFEKASNLHAGPSAVKSWGKTGGSACSRFRSLPHDHDFCTIGPQKMEETPGVPLVDRAHSSLLK